MMRAFQLTRAISTAKIPNTFLKITTPPVLIYIPTLYRCQQQEQYYSPSLQQSSSLLYKTLSYSIRFIELSFIFAPTVLCLPLCFFKCTRDLWLDLLLWGVKRAGIFWIKSFQYLSHRGDIIGQDMAQKFSVLRENSPDHSWQYTQETIQRNYGKSIKQMFEQFGQLPVASGSISQVYKAKLRGQIVAVKVRHPEAGKNMSRDIQLLFMFSQFFSLFSRRFEIPVTDASLKKILSEQLYFLNQKKNLDIFSTKRIDDDVRFPLTYPDSTNQVLIEQFIEGKTIAYYQKHQHQLNSVMANVGARAYYSMLFKHNFIHADCHAGNILVRITEDRSWRGKARNLYDQIMNYCSTKFISFITFNTFLKRLVQDNYYYQKQLNRVQRQSAKRVDIVLIDVGMAVRLTPYKKKRFQGFLQEVIKGDAQGCAKWIFRISQQKGKNIEEGKHNQYLQDLQKMFIRVHKTALQSLQGIVVVRQILEVIRRHHMKIDGEISILLTNMLILQSIAKGMDPNINILRCAVPYLHYQ